MGLCGAEPVAAAGVPVAASGGEGVERVEAVERSERVGREEALRVALGDWEGAGEVLRAEVLLPRAVSVPCCCATPTVALGARTLGDTEFVRVLKSALAVAPRASEAVGSEEAEADNEDAMLSEAAAVTVRAALGEEVGAPVTVTLGVLEASDLVAWAVREGVEEGLLLGEAVPPAPPALCVAARCADGVLSTVTVRLGALLCDAGAAENEGTAVLSGEAVAAAAEDEGMAVPCALELPSRLALTDSVLWALKEGRAVELTVLVAAAALRVAMPAPCEPVARAWEGVRGCVAGAVTLGERVEARDALGLGEEVGHLLLAAVTDALAVGVRVALLHLLGRGEREALPDSVAAEVTLGDAEKDGEAVEVGEARLLRDSVAGLVGREEMEEEQEGEGEPLASADRDGEAVDASEGVNALVLEKDWSDEKVAVAAEERETLPCTVPLPLTVKRAGVAVASRAGVAVPRGMVPVPLSVRVEPCDFDAWAVALADVVAVGLIGLAEVDTLRTPEAVAAPTDADTVSVTGSLVPCAVGLSDARKEPEAAALMEPPQPAEESVGLPVLCADALSPRLPEALWEGTSEALGTVVALVDALPPMSAGLPLALALGLTPEEALALACELTLARDSVAEEVALKPGESVSEAVGVAVVVAANELLGCRVAAAEALGVPVRAGEGVAVRQAAAEAVPPRAWEAVALMVPARPLGEEEAVRVPPCSTAEEGDCEAEGDREALAESLGCALTVALNGVGVAGKGVWQGAGEREGRGDADSEGCAVGVAGAEGVGQGVGLRVPVRESCGLREPRAEAVPLPPPPPRAMLGLADCVPGTARDCVGARTLGVGDAVAAPDAVKERLSRALADWLGLMEALREAPVIPEGVGEGESDGETEELEDAEGEPLPLTLPVAAALALAVALAPLGGEPVLRGEGESRAVTLGQGDEDELDVMLRVLRAALMDAVATADPVGEEEAGSVGVPVGVPCRAALGVSVPTNAPVCEMDRDGECDAETLMLELHDSMGEAVRGAVRVDDGEPGALGVGVAVAGALAVARGKVADAQAVALP